MELVQRIGKLLKKRNMTIYKLAQNCELTDKTIYKWFRGESQPTVKALYSICNALNITMAELFSEGEMIEVNSELKELYENYMLLSAEEQKAIKALIRRKK